MDTPRTVEMCAGDHLRNWWIRYFVAFIPPPPRCYSP